MSEVKVITIKKDKTIDMSQYAENTVLNVTGKGTATLNFGANNDFTFSRVDGTNRLCITTEGKSYYIDNFFSKDSKSVASLAKNIMYNGEKISIADLCNIDYTGDFKPDNKGVIKGSYFNDTIKGTDKADTIYSYSGHDKISVGKKNDTVILGTGYKEITIHNGDGNNTIKQTVADGATVKLYFDDNANLSYSRDYSNYDLIITNTFSNEGKETKEKLTIKDFYKYNTVMGSFNYFIGDITLHDAIEATGITLKGKAKKDNFIVGTDNDDIIYAGSKHNMIDAGLGNNKIYIGSKGTTEVSSGGGNDTYSVTGLGADTFISDLGGNDTLIINKIDHKDINLFFNVNTDGSHEYFDGEDTVYNLAILNNKNTSKILNNKVNGGITFENYFKNDSSDKIETIYLTDKTGRVTTKINDIDSWINDITKDVKNFLETDMKGKYKSVAEMLSSKNATKAQKQKLIDLYTKNRGNKILAGNNDITISHGKNTVYTGAGDDNIYSGTGNDTININGTGTKTIYFDAGDGKDTINGTHAQDVHTKLNFEEGLKISYTKSGNDVIIKASHEELPQYIYLKGGNYYLTKPSGKSTKINLKNMYFKTESGNVVLTADSSDGRSKPITKDSLYIINGKLTTNPENAQAVRKVVTDNTVTLKNYLNQLTIGDVSIDGEAKKLYEILNAREDFTTTPYDKTKAKKAQTINGTLLDEFYRGSKYADKIYTGEGKDTVYIQNGFGKDTIYTGSLKTSSTTLVFEDSAKLSYKRSKNDLLIYKNFKNAKGKNITETVTVKNYFVNGNNSTLYVEQGDLTQNINNIKDSINTSSTISITTRTEESVNGTASNDIIYSTATNATIDGGAGNDTIFVGEGTKTVVSNFAGGNDTIVIDKTINDSTTIDITDYKKLTHDTNTNSYNGNQFAYQINKQTGDLVITRYNLVDSKVNSVQTTTIKNYDDELGEKISYKLGDETVSIKASMNQWGYNVYNPETGENIIYATTNTEDSSTISDSHGNDTTYVIDHFKGKITDAGGNDTLIMNNIPGLVFNISKDGEVIDDNLAFLASSTPTLADFKKALAGNKQYALTIEKYFANDNYKIENFVINNGDTQSNLDIDNMISEITAKVKDLLAGTKYSSVAELFKSTETADADLKRSILSCYVTYSTKGNDKYTINNTEGTKAVVDEGGNDEYIINSANDLNITDNGNGNDIYTINDADKLYIHDNGGNDIYYINKVHGTNIYEEGGDNDILVFQDPDMTLSDMRLYIDVRTDNSTLSEKDQYVLLFHQNMFENVQNNLFATGNMAVEEYGVEIEKYFSDTLDGKIEQIGIKNGDKIDKLDEFETWIGNIKSKIQGIMTESGLTPKYNSSHVFIEEFASHVNTIMKNLETPWLAVDSFTFVKTHANTFKQIFGAFNTDYQKGISSTIGNDMHEISGNKAINDNGGNDVYNVTSDFDFTKNTLIISDYDGFNDLDLGDLANLATKAGITITNALDGNDILNIAQNHEDLTVYMNVDRDGNWSDLQIIRNPYTNNNQINLNKGIIIKDYNTSGEIESIYTKDNYKLINKTELNKIADSVKDFLIEKGNYQDVNEYIAYVNQQSNKTQLLGELYSLYGGTSDNQKELFETLNNTYDISGTATYIDQKGNDTYNVLSDYNFASSLLTITDTDGTDTLNLASHDDLAVYFNVDSKGNKIGALHIVDDKINNPATALSKGIIINNYFADGKIENIVDSQGYHISDEKLCEIASSVQDFLNLDSSKTKGYTDAMSVLSSSNYVDIYKLIELYAPTGNCTIAWEQQS